MHASNFALGSVDEVVENPVPLGWGYNSDLATHIGGSCWDLSSNPEDYAVVQNMDFVTATHRWSSTKEEAISEIHAEMDADADFGMIEADFGAVYDATTNSTQSAEVLTIKVFIRSVNVEFEMPDIYNTARCTGTHQNPMSSAEFLLACGDRYIAGQGYGGYLIFVADTSHLTTEDRQDISVDLGIDYSIGNGNLAAYINTFAKMEQNNVEFRVISRGFTQLLNLSGNPLDTVSPSDVLADLAILRQNWVQAANLGNFPDSDYGVVVDQQMNRYTNNTPLYYKCVGEHPDDSMTCFENLMHKTTGKIHQYKKWRALLNDHLNNMGDYYWGATTASANQNKDNYAEVVDNLDICLQKIEDLIDSCSQEARNPANQGLPKLVCHICNEGEVPYNCEPHHKYTDLCEDLSGPRIECDFDVLKSRVRSLSAEVIPIADLPNNGQMATMTNLSQHNPGVVLGDTSTTICALGGMSGELASTNEEVKLEQINNNWYFNVLSSRSGITHTLRGQTWCALQSYFFDGGQSAFTVHPDIEAHQYNNDIEFRDASNSVVPDKYARALNGVSGNFAGGAEQAEVNGYGNLKIDSNQGQLYAWGTAFGLDYPANGTIQHGFPNSLVAVSVATNDKPDQQWVRKSLISLGDGFCYLHHLGGEFDGKDEVARLYHEDGKWMLAVSGLCVDLDGLDLFSNGPCIERKQIEATASCYLYDQSQ